MNQVTSRKLNQDLNYFRILNMKPNFSALARQYGVHRKTVARYWKEGGKSMISRKRKSYLDDYLDEIREHANKTGANKAALFDFFKDKYGEDVFRILKMVQKSADQI